MSTITESPLECACCERIPQFLVQCEDCKQFLCQLCFDSHLNGKGQCVDKFLNAVFDNEPVGEKDGVKILPSTPKGFLTRKFIRCGKKNCKCQEGQLHGPYFYRVQYLAPGKKKWHYIGKIKEYH